MSSAVTPYNLLKSWGGKILPVEVNLEIIEKVLGQDAKSVNNLMLLSQDFLHLLKSFEYSIIRRIRPNQNVGYQFLPSCVLPELKIIRPMSYHWLSEIDTRDSTMNFLIQHRVSDIDFDSVLTGAITHVVSVGILASRVRAFKARAFALLYQLADCTVGLRSRDTVRERQEEFLHDLEKSELATLGFFIQTLGLRYSRLLAAAPGAANEGLLREITCVFEEKVLHYGPFFAFITITGSPEASAWSNFVMQEGLNDLREFEENQTTGCSSLQSVLWLRFSERANCSPRDGWNVATQIVEEELVSQRI